jgi:Tat protein secretion system quality control protein TatD with DNase activity
LKYVAEKLAEIKKVTVEEIAEKTTTNTKQLFGL